MNTDFISEYFNSQNIRIIENASNLLFCLKDVGDKIGDKYYSKTISNYDKKHKIKCNFPNKSGKMKMMVALTERGLYRYLIESNAEGSVGFREHLIELLCKIREDHVKYNVVQVQSYDYDNNGYDIEKFHKLSCIYIINIGGDIYKIGNTTDIKRRLSFYKTKLNFNKVTYIKAFDKQENTLKVADKIKSICTKKDYFIKYVIAPSNRKLPGIIRVSEDELVDNIICGCIHE